MANWSVTPENFQFVAKLLHEQCGLVLESGKEYLVASRLTPLAQKHQAGSVDLWIERVRDGRVNNMAPEIIEAMVTTETSFFRDLHPFETLKKFVLPELIERRGAERRLNIWCAASSSGQEPYSVAMLLHEYFPGLSTWRVNLAATDLSHAMLERARAGRYSQLEVNRGLPTPLLLKWFRQEGAFWCIDDRLRKAVDFAPINLTRPWPSMPMWDLIFLRNVMIYFDNEIKRSILERVERVLRPDGYLLLGGAETTLNLSDAFYRVESLPAGFYRRKSSR